MTTVLYCTIVSCTVLYHIKYYNVTSLTDTHLLIKLFMLGPLDKSLLVVVGGGGIAIIASSSRGPGET